jgi:hypothetical protein
MKSQCILWLSLPLPPVNDTLDSWYDHLGNDLHFRDFGFQACLQVACQLTQHANRSIGQYCILEWLLTDGSFNQEESQVVHTAEEYVMQHTSAIRLQLLACVEDLE